jgi:hypothetical protein
MGKMSTMDHRIPRFGSADVTQPSQDGPVPSGWWILPGLLVGLGLWALIGLGVHAAVTGGDDGMMMVTQAQMLDPGVAPLD